MSDDAPPASEGWRGKRRIAALALRYAVAVALLYLILKDAPLDAVLATLRSASVPLILTAAGCQLASLYVAAHRWRVLLLAANAKPPSAARLWAENVVAYALNFLPTGVVGDVARAQRVATPDIAASTSLGIVVAEKVIGLIALCVLQLLAEPFSHVSGLAVRVADSMAWAGAAGGLAWLVLVFKRPGLFEERALAWLPPVLSRLVVGVVPPPPVLVRVFLLSLLVQLVYFGTGLAMIACIEPHFAIADAIRMIPAMGLANFFHITPGNFGQREATFVWFLAPLGISAERALAISAINLVLVPIMCAAAFVAYAISLTRPSVPDSVETAQGRTEDQ